MKKNQQLNPIKLATSATILTSTATLFATILNLITSIPTFVPFLELLYQNIGYSSNFTGAILTTLYVAIDTFIMVYLFAWIYNKLL